MTHELNATEIETVSGGINPLFLPAIVIVIPGVLEEMSKKEAAEPAAE